jgi:hypothetical protein
VALIFAIGDVGRRRVAAAAAVGAEARRAHGPAGRHAACVERRSGRAGAAVPAVPCRLLPAQRAGGGLARAGRATVGLPRARTDLCGRGAAALCAGSCQRRVGKTLGPAQARDREQEGALVLQCDGLSTAASALMIRGGCSTRGLDGWRIDSGSGRGCHRV